mgnify:FL=1
MRIQSPLKCIIYWLLLVIIMMLHFNYHVGEIFYGIDVARENADGIVPVGTHVIRNIFYHLPFVWIIVLLSYQSNLVRVGLFIISVVYWMSHLVHLFKDLANPGFSQTPLLLLALFISSLLTLEHYKYWKTKSC